MPEPRRSAPTSVPAMATYAPTQPAVAPPAVPASSVSIPAESSVRLQYKDQSPIQVRGLATGLIYSFSGAQSMQEVDQRDAPSLLQTRYFRQV